MDLEKEIHAGLERAAVLIEEKGWCQRESVDLQGRFCTIGALGRSFNNPVNQYTAYGRACDHLATVIFGMMPAHPIREIANWNDEGNRKVVDVTEALRKASTTPVSKSILGG